MRSGKLGAALAVALAAAFVAESAFAQANNGNNQNNGGTIIGNLPAGVLVSPDGVLRVKQFADKTGQLAKIRAAEARARLAAELARPSELRKISLTRLEAAMAERLANGQEPTEEMKNLAGLTRLQYVFYYPESKEIVIAGPAEGFMADPTGRMIGVNSGRAVLELQDLVAALRAFPPTGKQTHLISVSIDPTAEGLDRKSTRLNSSHWITSRMPSSA